MFEFLNFFTGAGNGNDLRNAGKFISDIDKMITKLGKNGQDGAKEQITNLLKARNEYNAKVDGFSSALKAGSGVDTARDAFKTAHGEAKDAFKGARSYVRSSTWLNRGQKFGSFMASTPGKVIAGAIAIPTLLVAGAAAAGMISSSRNKKAMESREDLMMRQMEKESAEVAALQQQTMAMQQQRNTMMGLEPVHGKFAEDVVNKRNGGMGMNTGNPAMTAANYEPVPARG